jgi:hypothetical protein
VPSHRPSPSEVEKAIKARLHAGASLHVEDIAMCLYVSKSTLQRTLAERSTTFTQVRRQVQVKVAVERLSGGASCAGTAAHVRLSADHMCKLVTEYTDLTPRQIVRACQLAERVRRWRRSAPPPADSKLYFTRLERWRAIDDELARLVANLSPDSPLAAWAEKLHRSARRPDYRRGRHRARARAERRREGEVLMVMLRQAAAWNRQQQREQDKAVAMPDRAVGGSHV